MSLGDWPLSIYPSCRSIIGFRLGQAQGAHSESYHLNTVLLPLGAHESPPSITAPYFSSCSSDSTSRWTPCAPENCRLVASGPPWRVSGFRFRARLGFVIPSTFSGPRGITPRVRIWRPSFRRQRDFNPPEQRCSAHTLPSADFCRPVRMDRSTLSPDSRTNGRSPEVSSTAFRPQPPDFQPAPLMDMGLPVMGPLAQHRMPLIRFLYISSYVCSALL